ncbi:MAG: TIGR01777 family oxidoreductase [Flavobacteriales bacterium]
MFNVVITGGSGLIGMQLAQLLIDNGYNVTILTRGNRKNSNTIKCSFWDIENQLIDLNVITKADYIIHLAGEQIAEKRWTKKQQQKILRSRVEPTAFLFEVLSNHKNQLKAFISASGIGYYGAITSDVVFTEEYLHQSDFLGETCKSWEDSVDKFNEIGVRTVKLRTGIVLSKNGGALPKMMVPFKYGFGSALGSGNQFMPWIHIEDLCAMYLKAVQDTNMYGSYNAVVSDDVTNSVFSKALAKTLNKKILLPNIPGFVLKVVLGKMAVLLLKGSRVSNKKIKDAGFSFRYENIEQALLTLI